jgi:deazaflavin-dependent oxidoreductase (nitroreductase family)
VAGDAGDLDFCYLTTVGRVSGSPHQIEIWFALHEGFVYFLSGGGEGSDWVKNLIADPSVTLRLGEETRATTARLVSASDEDALARRLLVEKYRPRYSGELEGWGQTATPIAVEWGTPQVV